MTSTEIRNTLGIYDDDMLNAACECERKDELADKIAHAIVNAHGYDRGLYNGHVFKFDKVRKVLKDFGFEYCWSDDEREEHRFMNHDTKDEISIFPKTYYPNQCDMRFSNFLLF